MPPRATLTETVHPLQAQQPEQLPETSPEPVPEPSRQPSAEDPLKLSQDILKYVRDKVGPSLHSRCRTRRRRMGIRMTPQLGAVLSGVFLPLFGAFGSLVLHQQ